MTALVPDNMARLRIHRDRHHRLLRKVKPAIGWISPGKCHKVPNWDTSLPASLSQPSALMERPRVFFLVHNI
ncbi:unnamed protein product, partial [Rangifer tarandus platyrhynchus]